MVTDITADAGLVACCGLYCGACRAHRSGRCTGCRPNEKRAWCKVRACCIQRGYATCAECQEHPDPNGCRTFNNPIARMIGFVFRSDRAACIAQVRLMGAQKHAEWMAECRRHTIRR